MRDHRVNLADFSLNKHDRVFATELARSSGDSGPKPGQQSGIGLLLWRRVGPEAGSLEAETHQCFGQRHCRCDTIDDGEPVLASEFIGKIDHAGTAEHDGLRAITADRGNDFVGDFGAGVFIALLQCQDRDFSGANACTSLGQAVFSQIVLDRHDGDAQRGDHCKASGNQARGVEGRFSDADHRRAGDRASRIEACVVEAGDDMRIRAIAVGSRMHPSMPGTANASS
jgi:hypothetical protein